MPDYYDDERDCDMWEDDDNCGDCGQCEDCFEMELQNCGMQPDGSCNLAGTEYCDWDCRMRELEDEDEDPEVANVE